MGGFITEVRSWLQIRRDQVQTLNLVLYSQLDVWHTVRTGDPAAVLLALPRILANRFGVPETEWQALFQSLEHLDVFLTTLISTSIPKELEVKYEAAVDRLAGVHPILAFRLSGRPALNQYTQTWRTAMDAWLETQQATENDRRVITSLQPVLEQKTRSSLLQTLENDLRDVAGAIGWQTRRRLNNLIKKSKEAPDKTREQEVADLVEGLIKSAIAQMQVSVAKP